MNKKYKSKNKKILLELIKKEEDIKKDEVKNEDKK
jgi:hypothetical protein